MSKVARIELFHVAIPLPAPFYPSWIPGYPQTENRFTLVKITTDDGVEGYSAGPALSRERSGLGELLGPYLIGEDATDIGLIQQRLREMSYLGWRNFWIEPAFWDIKGKMADKPVYELLGGTSVPVRLYASCGDLKSPTRLAEEIEQRYAEGFRSVKIRVHDSDPSVDERIVTETMRAVGSKVSVGVDPNQGWRVTIVRNSPPWDLARAKRFADVCADAGVSWLEEPLAMDAYDDQSALTAYSRIPTSGGELHTSGLPELKMMIERRCYSIFQPDAVFTGGIAQTLEVINLCRLHGLGYTPHTWTNGIGLAINLQLMVASGFADRYEMEYPLNPPGWTVEARDGILEEPFRHGNGILHVPGKPGLGFSIDRAALLRYGRRYFFMDRPRLSIHSVLTKGFRISREIQRARAGQQVRADLVPK